MHLYFYKSGSRIVGTHVNLAYCDIIELFFTSLYLKEYEILSTRHKNIKIYHVF